ncbi:MAG: SMC family ATPase [Pyrinomonadaceae bacterium]
MAFGRSTTTLVHTRVSARAYLNIELSTGMLIKRVELENIKSHAESTFEFERGSTAITGPNGAGKTTIIEAIAWALFDLLAYKKDEFLRRGTKKGSVRVTFESSLDEREYSVYRDTMTGYYVYDPQLGFRIAEKKEEVTRFLWQHLGVEPGTDLETLFKHAIGVPQGTYTAIFLATAAERKKTFDTLLKVEEYRRSADELLRTARYVENQIQAVVVRIARAEGEVGRIDEVTARHSEFSADVTSRRLELEKVEVSVGESRASVLALDEIESRIGSMSAEVEKLRTESQRAEFLKNQRASELQHSKEASEKIAVVRVDAELHQKTLGRIHELEREREERQKMRDGLAKVETAAANVRSEQVQLRAELERIQKAHSTIAELQPKLADQERLEKEVARLRTEFARAEAADREVKSIDEQLEALRESYRVNQAQLKSAQDSDAKAAEVDQYQARDGEIVREIARLQASIERDEAFQREVRNGVCPILSERCLNLKDGQTLEGFLNDQFVGLRSKVESLQQEHVGIATALGVSREAVKVAARAPAYEARLAEIKVEGEKLNERKAAALKDKSPLADAESQLRKAEAELSALDNPKARITVLKTDLGRESEIRQKVSLADKNLERLESDRRIAVEQTEAYKDLDSNWTAATADRERTAEAYRTFIANEAAASLLAERESQFAEVEKELLDVSRRLSEAESAFADAGKGYDRERHLVERQALVELEKRQVELRTTLDAAERRLAELAVELERLEAVRRSMQDEFREKERLEKVLETTDFIRTTLKEAAPLVARNYVWHVSQEANLLYRDITGNAERTLKWTEDYSISLEEGGYDRPFVSLSGGEQMAAALSVRLALLKQLSDIRVAFFDEPTTNMDAERRENLAQQIGQIHHFDQLFVISHDDTFDSYMDHEMRVEK